MTLDEIILPDDLEWIDEIGWSPIAQSTARSATGALLIQESEMQYGRPITLQGDVDMAWITRQTVDALRAKRDQKGLKMTLTINGEAYAVMFRHQDKPVDVSPIRQGDFFDPESNYKVDAIKLMEVEA